MELVERYQKELFKGYEEKLHVESQMKFMNYRIIEGIPENIPGTAGGIAQERFRNSQKNLLEES